MNQTGIKTVGSTISRPLTDAPQTIVKVYETSTLGTDLREYVLTDQLAKELAKVVNRVVDSARPGAGQTDKIGVWVSGFFGSGKSHFAKLVGHLLADSPVSGGGTARGVFTQILHTDRAADEQVREAFQRATVNRMKCHLVAFDMMAQQTAAAEKNVGLTFLRAFYESIGLSKVVAFAECELELINAGKHDQFEKLYAEKSDVSWDEDKDLAGSSVLFAECLAIILPDRYRTTELAQQSLTLATAEVENFGSIDDATERLLRWVMAEQNHDDGAEQKIVFVADEVGAWAGRNRDRISQISALADAFAAKGLGRLWLIATSQERLSAVVQNASIADAKTEKDLLQRLEDRFQINVHLESSEVGTVIEDRILRKLPTAVPALEELWDAHQQQLADFAQPPGLELGPKQYPPAACAPFVKDYPFLPYQLEAAADIFGGMRGVRISSGARSMIGVAFDALHTLASRPLSAVVSWDQIFDSANRDNEFADEQYLGGQGLEYIASADKDVLGSSFKRPSRLLKTLWLVQQTARIPRTDANLARLLVDAVDTDVLQLQQEVAETLRTLEEYGFVRHEPATGQWKFLTQDEVTIEKVVRRISEDVKQKQLRDEVFSLYEKQLRSLFSGRITVGKSNTAFDYRLSLNSVVIRNEKLPVDLSVRLVASAGDTKKIAETAAQYLESPEVIWAVPISGSLEDRLRRALAIEQLQNDEEYRRIATDRTKTEAAKLLTEADELRQHAAADVANAYETGTLFWAGNEQLLDTSGGAGARSVVEDALKDRVKAHYSRFSEGDVAINAANVEKLFVVSPADRAGLDPVLNLFDTDGHVNGSNAQVEELSRFLKSSAKTSGQDVDDRFSAPPFGWSTDLMRYVAAAMFVDSKLSASDKAGKHFDDLKQPGARALFATAPFRTTRLEVEEDSLTPDESRQAAGLLDGLRCPATDGSESSLRDATLQLAGSLTKRLATIERAKQVDLPLPASYAGIAQAVDALTTSTSKVKTVRALLDHSEQLREAVKGLEQLKRFSEHFGFEQYRRSRQLLTAAIDAGLTEDGATSSELEEARTQLDALRDRADVLAEWDGAYMRYRRQVIDSFRSAYEPLRRQLHERSTAARQKVLEMPEYDALSLPDRTEVRVRFLGEGRTLQQVLLPKLTNEEQLLEANSAFSIPYMRSALASLDGQVTDAQTLVYQLYSAAQDRPQIATWSPAKAFAGKKFTSEAEVDAAFDAEKERLKELLKDGKMVQVV